MFETIISTQRKPKHLVSTHALVCSKLWRPFWLALDKSELFLWNRHILLIIYGVTGRSEGLGNGSFRKATHLYLLGNNPDDEFLPHVYDSWKILNRIA